MGQRSAHSATKSLPRAAMQGSITLSGFTWEKPDEIDLDGAMALFLIPSASTSKVYPGKVFLASLLGHVGGWIAFAALTILSLPFDQSIKFDGQGEGLLLGMLVVLMVATIPLATILAIIWKKLGFSTFFSSIVIGAAVPFTISAFFFLPSLLTEDDAAAANVTLEFIFLQPYIISYGNPCSTFFDLSIRWLVPPALSEDWINTTRNRRLLVFLPFLVVFSFLSAARYFGTI